MATDQNNNSRRQFLRNTALVGFTVGLLPNLARAKNNSTNKESGGCNPTTLDYYGQGPFYTANAPQLAGNLLASPNEPGTRLIVSGVVQNLSCTAILGNTLLDIWHANDGGAYDTVGYNLRGKIYANSQGFYSFETILPGKYLNGAAYRPSHIHFKITPPGFPTLITQLYFQGDVDIPADAAASITSGTYDASHRIIPITLNVQGQYEGTWDISIDGNGNVGVADLHSDKGIIYSASPNPFSDLVEIRYGVFMPAKVKIQVFDMRGSLVATLDEQELLPQRYTAVWKPEGNMPGGIYFIALKLNDLQVHYLKVVKI